VEWKRIRKERRSKLEAGKEEKLRKIMQIARKKLHLLLDEKRIEILSKLAKRYPYQKIAFKIYQAARKGKNLGWVKRELRKG